MTKEAVIIGVDNGTTGAVCALNARCTVVALADTPVIVDDSGRGKRVRYLTDAMVTLLDDLAQRFDVRCVVVEKGQVMKNGGIATFLAGYCEGAWVCICQALGLPSQSVAASTWQHRQLRDVPGKDTKARSILQASRLFPGLELVKPGGQKPTLHGRADAALLARYGVLELNLLGMTKDE